MTICKCSHLTHFAILLSAQRLNFSEENDPNEMTFLDQLFDLLESVDMQKLVVTASNLSSILRDVGDQTVGLEFSKVGYAACMKITNVHDYTSRYTHCMIIICTTTIIHYNFITCMHAHNYYGTHMK